MAIPTVSSIRNEMKSRTSNAVTRPYGRAYNSAMDEANALAAYSDARRQQEEYERYKRSQELQNVVSPDMTADSMSSYAQYKNTKGAQLANYDLLSDDVKNALSDIDQAKKDTKFLGIANNPYADTSNYDNLVSEFKDKYGVDNDTLDALRDIRKMSGERDSYNEKNGAGAYEQKQQDYSKEHYVRTYDEEIDYARSKFSEAAQNVDELRADIARYNSQVEKRGEDYFTRPTIRESIKGLTDKESADDIKQQLMNKYGLTDDEIEDLAYYGKELDNYDERNKQQEQAEANVNTGDTKRDIAGGAVNSAVALTTYLPGAVQGVAETGKYYAGRLTGTAHDKHSPIDANSAAFEPSNATSDLQGATQQRISDWNAVAGMVYGAGMSTAESALTSVLAPAGGASKVGRAVAGLAPFAASAFTSELSDNVTSGQEMDAAMRDALISAGVETGTEFLPFDHFWDVAQGSSRTARKALVNFIVQSGFEGAEEMAGDIADLVIDEIIYGDKSDFNQSIQAYINDGMSEEDARAQAERDWTMQFIQDGITGAMSGAMGGAGATAIGVHTNNQRANELFSGFGQQDYADFAEGLNTDERTYVNKSAARSMQEAKTLAEQYSTQDKVSAKDVRKLYYAYTDAVDTETEAQQKLQEKAEEAARKAEKRAARNANQSASDTAVEAAPAQAYSGIGSSSGEAVIPFSNPNSAEAMQYRATREEESAQRAEQDRAFIENMPEELRPASNDYTGNEIHKRMTKAATVEDLQNVVIDGMMSNNVETRRQTQQSLETLTPMLNKNISMEEIESLKQSDADIIRAGYNGDEISTFTSRQKQLYNYGQQQAIETRTAVNNEQREAMVQQSQSIKDDSMRELVTSHFQTGYNTGAYMNTLNGIANAQRTGMTFDEALDAVKVNADAIGGDAAVIKAAEEAVFNYSVDLTRAETMNEIQKSMGLQNRVTKFGNGLFTDARSDRTSDLKGVTTMRNIAKATGFNIVVYDNNVENLSNTLRSSQGVFRASNSTIYLNASEADQLAGTLYHELGEAISVYAPEEYQKFSKAVQNAVIKRIGINAFNEARETFIRDYAGEAGKTEVDIDKEMTNDLLYQFLGSEEGMKALLEEIDSSNTAEDARTIKQKLADWVSDLARTLREFFDGFKPTAYQRKVADAQIAQLEGLADMLNKSAAAAVRNYQQARAKDQQSRADVVSEMTEITDEQLDAMFDPNNKEQGELPDDLGFVDDDGTLRFSLATKDTSMKFLQEYLSRQEDLTEAQKEDIVNRLELAARITQDLADQQYAYFSTWQKMGLRTAANGVPLIDIIPKSGDKPLASVAVNNGEYPLNVDFSQICKKRATLNAVINTLVDEYGVLLPTLTESDLNTINKHIKDHGFEIACGLCFVDAKRYRSGKWAESFTGEYSPSIKRKYNRKTKQYDEYYELKKPKNAKVGYNDLVATLAAKDGSEVSASYFDYSTENEKPNIRTVDQLSEEEIDKSGLLEYIKPYAKYNENGELTGIGGYKDENGKQRNPDEVAKMAYAIYSEKDMRHFLDKNDMMSDAGLDAIRDNNPTLYSLINAHWGAGKPKLNLGGTAYGGEIIRSQNWGKNNDFNAESARKVGGVRVQSFSDYEANMFFDYCQMFADMEARKLTSHGYTKETDYVRIFGLTGQKINMSIVARGAKLSKELEEAYNRLTKNSNTKLFTDKKYGEIFQDIRDNSGINREAVDKWMNAHPESAGMSVSDAARQMLKEGMSVKDVLLVEADEETGINETFNLDDALYYQSAEGYRDNCGIIWIGTSAAQIWVLLDAEEVSMIIPYHSSGVSGFIKRERNLLLFHDYTKEQNTRFRDGSSITGEDDAAEGGRARKISKGVDFDFYEALYRLNDPKAAADEYLAWCDQHDYIPKFDTFRGHDNYYKLLIDFKVYDYNGIDPAKVAARQYLPQQEVHLNLPENVAEMVKESVTAQEALIDRRNKELTAGGKNLISDVARDLHLEERAKEEMQVRRGVDDLGLSDESDADRRSAKGRNSEEISVNGQNLTVSNDGTVATDENGKVYAVVTLGEFSNNKVRKNWSDVRKHVAAELAKIAGKRITIKSDGTTVYADKKFADEFLWSDDTRGGDYRYKKTKVSAYSNIEAIVREASYLNWEPNKEKKHRYDAKRGWRYYAVNLLVRQGDNAKLYDAVLNVRMSGDSKDYIYDITQINKAADQTEENPHLINMAASTESVMPADSDVNDNLSLGDAIETPTQVFNDANDSEIRKSMRLDNNRNMNNENISEDRDKQAAILEKGTEALKGTKVNDALVDRIADNMLSKTSSAYDRTALKSNLKKLFAYLHGKGNVNKNDFLAVMQDVVRPVIDAAYTSQASREDYAQFRNAIDGRSFSITEEQRKAIKDAFGSMATFERYYPEIHISEDAPSLSSQWSELVDISRGLMESDIEDSDMPGILADTFEALRPSMNDFEDQTQAAYELALETVGDYLANYHNDGATKGVINEMVDDTARKLKTAQKEWKKAAKERYDERLYEERKRLREQARNRVKAANERNEEQIAKLRAKNATRIGNIYERQRRREQMRNIRKTYKRLYDYATKPTDQKHIPTVLQEPVYNLLAAFDMSGAVVTQGEDGKWHTKIISGRKYDNETGKYKYVFEEISADTKDDAMRQYNEALDRGLGTQSGREWYNRMQKINELYKDKAKADKDDTSISQEMSDVYELLSDELADDFDKILKASASSKATLSDLGSDQLRTISNVFRNVMHAVEMVNRSYTVPSAEVRDMAVGVINKSQKVVGRKVHDWDWLNQLDNFMGLANMNPYTYMHVIGADRMRDVLIYGQNTKAKRLRQAQEYSIELFKDMSDAEYRDWNTERTYLNGKVKATPFQVINIYNAAQRPDAAQHFPGGFLMRDAKGRTRGDVIHLTNDEIRRLTATLTDKQKRIAAGMQQFLANDCADWNNETSELIYGYSHFGDPHYWSITTDKTTVRSNPGELTGSITNSVKNMGMTKAIKQGANNPLIIDSALDVYLKHINDAAVYSSWAAPLQDMLRFFNYKEVITHDDGSVEYVTTKNAIRKMLGDKGNQYFTKLYADIQHREQSSFEDPGNLAKFTGNAKKAATMANLRVALQQPTAIMRAGRRISYKYLEQGVRSGTPGMDTELKRLQQQMIGTDMVYWIKQQGNIDGQITTTFKEQITGFKGTGLEKVNNQITEAAGWLPGYMDQITWEAMYRACIAEQIDVLGRDKIGTQEFQDAVNYKFDHLMLETQVYDGTITRSQFMRSADKYAGQLTAFMAEPVKTYNLVLSDAMDLMQSGDNTAMRKVAAKALRKTLKVLAITAVTNASAQSFQDAMRNAGDPDDEDDLNFIQRFIEAMGWDYDAENWRDQLYAVLHGNLADNIYLWNNVPIINDLAGTIDGMLSEILFDKTSYSSSDSLDSQWASHLDDWYKSMRKTLARDQETRDNNTKTGYDLFAKTARVISDFTGVPVYSAQRDLVAIYNTVIARGVSGGRLPVLLKDKTSDKRQTKNDVYTTIMNSTDLDEVRSAVDEAAEHSNSYESINEGMKKNLKDELVATYKQSPSEATKMINRIAEIKAYCGDQYDTPKGKTHRERVEYYTKQVKKWLE